MTEHILFPRREIQVNKNKVFVSRYFLRTQVSFTAQAYHWRTVHIHLLYISSHLFRIGQSQAQLAFSRFVSWPIMSNCKTRMTKFNFLMYVWLGGLALDRHQLSTSHLTNWLLWMQKNIRDHMFAAVFNWISFRKMIRVAATAHEKLLPR